LKRSRGIEHSTGSAAVPTTLAETKIYKIKIVCCSTIIVGTLGYLPALHTNNGSSMITQRRNRKYYIPTTKKNRLIKAGSAVEDLPRRSRVGTMTYQRVRSFVYFCKNRTCASKCCMFSTLGIFCPYSFVMNHCY
jgi:hypothetical protein